MMFTEPKSGCLPCIKETNDDIKESFSIPYHNQMMSTLNELKHLVKLYTEFEIEAISKKEVNVVCKKKLMQMMASRIKYINIVIIYERICL